MAFTFEFLRIFMIGLGLLMLLFLLFCILVVILGQIVGRLEGWNRFDSLYWSFITAFTVGYGDIRPTLKPAKILSILIALLGILFTGLLVAMTVNAATIAFNNNFIN